MYRFFRWYNQNRRMIWIAIIAIVIIGFIVFRLFNMMTDSMKSTNNNITYEDADLNSFNSVSVTNQKSAISGDNVSNIKESVTIIDDFVLFCNSGNVEEAYKLLSDECKENMYPTVNDFKNSYYSSIFGNGKKMVNVENWIGNIYKIDFNEDSLAIGKYTKDNTIQDFITIVKDNNNNSKLNINKYVGTSTINKSAEVDGVSIKAVRKDSYMDYEYYTFEVTNNTDHDIALGDTTYIDVSYLTDANGLKYNAYNSELSQSELNVSLSQTKTVRIKYFNQYSSTRSIKNVVFPKAYLDYDGTGNHAQIIIDL